MSRNGESATKFDKQEARRHRREAKQARRAARKESNMAKAKKPDHEQVIGENSILVVKKGESEAQARARAEQEAADKEQQRVLDGR